MLKQRVKRKIKQITAGVLSAAMMLTILPVQVIGDDEYIETGVAETTTAEETEIVTDPIVTEVSETEIPVTETVETEVIETEAVVTEAETSETVTEMYENIVVPINLTRTAIDESSVTVAWDLTDTASYYEVYCNGNVFASNIVNTSYKLTGLNGGTEYYITVNAYSTDGILVGTSNEICVHTSWIIKSDTTLDRDIIVENLYLNSGTLNVNGHTVTVNNDLGIGSGTLYVNGGSIYVANNFNQRWTSGDVSWGYLQMTNSNDYICVNGDYYCYAGYSHNGKLTNGILEVKGDFTQKKYSQSNNFYATDNHRVILSGESKQTVSFENMESRVNVLDIMNFSIDGVEFMTPINAGTLNRNGCNVIFANGELSGWTLAEDETYNGDLNLSMGTLDLNGNKLTITGNLIHSGGTISVNNGVLEVQGDYLVQSLNNGVYGASAGTLNMINDADTVKVFGDFVMQSTASHSGKLTAGILEIGGDFTQKGGSAYNFCTSGTHTVILNGSEAQTISIANNSKDYSRFNNLKITNTSETGVNYATDVYVIGDLYNTDSAVTNSNRIILTGNFADNAWNHDIWINESRTLNADMEIGGTLYLNGGTLNLNGYNLTVNGDVYLGAGSNTSYLELSNGKLYVNGNLNIHRTNGSYSYGYLTMENADDYVYVNGNFTVYSYYAYSTYIAGTIEIKGNLIQKNYYSSNNFCTGKNLTVILSGDSKQLVNFTSVNSSVQTLEIRNYSEEGVVFETNVTTGTIIDNGCNITFVNGERAGWTLEDDETFEGDLYLARGTLDLNGNKLTVTGNLIHSGGTVLINGGELEIQGDYRVQAANGEKYTASTGVLNMTNEADTVKVLGDFIMQSTASHSGKLTAGTLEIGGDLTQLYANYYNFDTSGTHTIVLNGTEKQTVAIDSYSNSKINNLKITNTSSEGVTIDSYIYVAGILYNTETPVSNGTNIYMLNTAMLADNAWNHDIRFTGNWTLENDLYIGGMAVFDGGTFDLNEHIMTVGSVNLWSTTLKINGGQLLVDGNFNFGTTSSYSRGYLQMTNENDYVLVGGNFYDRAYYSQSGKLTAGVLEVKGNFTQVVYYSENNFYSTGTHKTIFSGNVKQTVSFANLVSRFNVVEILNTSEEGVVFSTPVTIDTVIDNGCNVTFANGERAGWTLEGDETVEGDLFLARGTLDLNGNKLTVTGNLIHSGGTILVNGGTLEVQGDYRIQAKSGTNYVASSGILNMTNEADTVKVLGDFIMQSTASHSGKLTAGTLEIGGDLTQLYANYYNFDTSGTHTIVLNGTEMQTVDIDSYSNSKINNLKITNTSSEGVTIDSYIYVTGTLYNTETPVSNGANIYMLNTSTFADNAWNHNIRFTGNWILENDLYIGGLAVFDSGTFDLNGHVMTVGSVNLWGTTLKINGGQLLVDGNFNFGTTSSYSRGSLQMTNENDYVLVGGNFYDRAYYSQSGQLTAGVLEVKGNFTEAGYNEKDFYATNNHKTIFSGNAKQTVSFDNLVSRFNIVEIRNTSEDGVVFSTPVTIDTVIDNGCNVTFANGERAGWILESDETFEGDLFLARGTLDLNGNKLNVTGNLIHSGGTILVNGGTLEVQGDYRVQAKNGTNYAASTGVLNMTNEADTVKVLGDFVMQSNVSHSGKLTAGTLEIGGDLTQLYANHYNFDTSGNHTIVLNGTEKQTVDIDSYSNSKINNLKITNTSSEGVSIDSVIYLAGALYNTETQVAKGANIYMLSTAVFADNTWNHNIRFVENRILENDLHIGGLVSFDGGTFDLNGHTMTVGSYVNLWGTTLKINGGQLLVDGDFNYGTTSSYSRGYLQMTNENDYVLVGGNFYDRAYYSQSGKLTAGVLEVKGNFTQVTASNQYNFYPTGTHKTILSGNKVQAISFASNVSQFNILEITKPINTGYKFSRAPLWNTLIEGIPDTEPPTAPENLECVRSTSSSIMMTWDKSEDNKTVIGYNIYRDGELVGETSELQYIDNGLSSHSAYVYYVTACDIDGNESKWSNVIEAETDVDEFAPTQPVNLSATVRSETTVNLAWTGSSDNGTVEKYNIYRNDILIGSSNGTSYTDNTAFSGFYEYCVEAVDNDDNTSKKSAKVSVDNAAPSAPELTISSANDLYVKLEWTGYDNVGVVRYEVYKNNIKTKTVDVTTYIDSAIVIDSNYEYYVVAYDAYGNASEKSNIATVYTGEDDEAPTITGIQPVSELNSGNAVIRISAKDNRGLDKIFIEASSNNIDWTAVGTVSASKGTSETVNSAVDTTEYPDGKLYIRAYAEDIKGNVGLASDSPICEITVDNTAPETVKDLAIDVSDNRIEIIWTAPVDEDTAFFRVYRKIGDEEFKLIKDNYTYISYYDTDVELGMEYVYTITAVDNCGNESDYAQAVEGCMADDLTKPEILSISPANNSKIGEAVSIGVSCRDNYKLGHIVVTCKAAGSETESVVYDADLDKYAQVVKFELDTKDFENGIYEISALVTDSVGNIGEKYTVAYDYKCCELSKPLVSATPAGWSVNLEWSMTDTERLVDYYIYRKDSAVSDYYAIAAVTETSYIDTDVTAGQKYYYIVRAWDDRDNYIESDEVCVSPTYEDNFIPTADAGSDLFGIVGESVKFNGTNSTDNHYIESYEWNFGDGSTASGATPEHTYSKEGEYVVTLSVKDSAGNSSSDTLNLYVYSDDFSKVEITTKSNGSKLGKVLIYCELPNSETTDYYTDANGNFTLIAPKGTYTAYFYKSGYKPVSSEINVGSQSKLYISLSKEQFITDEWKVTPLTLDEIIALGIDVNDPDNQVVFSYTVEVEGNGKISFTVNSSGDILGDNFAEFIYEDHRTMVKARPISRENSHGGRSSKRGSSSSGSSSGGSSEDEDLPMIAIFTITTNISWLKEFFDISLTINNEADPEFYLENAKAEIYLPNGLSFADTARGEWKSQSMGTISGGQSSTASWIVRGDKAGEYTDVKAKFTSTLMPFGEPIAIDFINDDAPIVVHDGEGIDLKVYANEYDTYWSMKFVLTNNSGRPLYNVLANFEGTVDVGEITDMILYYGNGNIVRVPWVDGKPDEENKSFFASAFDELSIDEDTAEKIEIASRTLENGETLTGVYSVYKK